ncbi:MAG TPA: hypothetical protein VHH88_04240, partial [Verrucomicrobiae bacterium]|nr:hypothetical protein [Verrucomicrobiae bacterium]
MNPMRSGSIPVLVAVSLCIGLAGGYQAGKRREAARAAKRADAARSFLTASNSLSGSSRFSVKKAANSEKSASADYAGTLASFHDLSELSGAKWSSFIGHLSPLAARELLVAVEKNPSKAMKSALRASLLAKWAEEDPAGALAYARNIANKSEREYEMLGVVRSWARNDPSAVAAWVEQSPSGPFRSQAVEAALRILATSNPEAALDLYQNSGVMLQAYGLMNSIFGPLAEKDAASAAARAQALPAGRQRTEALQQVALVWAQHDRQGALAWANGLRAGSEKNTVIAAIVSAWAADDLSGATAWIEQLPVGAEKQRALASLGSQWGQTDPKAALAYATSLPSSSTRSQIIGSVLGQWAQQDAAAALDYARSL